MTEFDPGSNTAPPKALLETFPDENTYPKETDFEIRGSRIPISAAPLGSRRPILFASAQLVDRPGRDRLPALPLDRLHAFATNVRVSSPPERQPVIISASACKTLMLCSPLFCLLACTHALRPNTPSPTRPDPTTPTEEVVLVSDMGRGTSAVSALAFSPNSQYFAAGDYSGTIWLFELETRRVFRRMDGPGRVSSLAISQNGKLIASGDFGGRISVWKADSGNLVCTISAHKGAVSKVAWRREADAILSFSEDDSVAAHQIPSGTLLWRFGDSSSKVTSAAFANNGLWTAIGLSDGSIRLHDNRNNLPDLTASGKQGLSNALAFSADDRFLASGGAAGGALLWEVATLKAVSTLEVTNALDLTAPAIRSIVPYARRPAFLMLLGKRSVATWTLDDGASGQFDVDFDADSITVSPDSRCLLVRGGAQAVLFGLNPPFKAELQAPGGPNGSSAIFLSSAFAPDSKWLVTGFSGDDGAGPAALVDLANLETGQGQPAITSPFAPVAESVGGVRFARHSPRMLTFGPDGTGILWNLQTGAPVRSFHYSRETCWQGYGGDVSPDGTKVLLGCNGIARLWDVLTGSELGQFPSVGQLSFSFDGSIVVSGYAGQVWIRDVAHLEAPRSCGTYRYPDSFEGAAISPDRQRLLIADRSDSVAAQWDLATCTQLQGLQCDANDWGINGVAFSPSGGQLLGMTAGRRGSICLWDLHATAPGLLWARTHMPTVTGVGFSNDGKYAISTGADQNVRLWDAISGNQARKYATSSMVARSAAMTPDTTALAAADGSGHVTIWNTAEQRELVRVFTQRNGIWAVIAPSGQFDSNDLETVRGLSWVTSDAPMHALSIETFMRDFYEPSMLARSLTGELRSPERTIMRLNRLQPRVQIERIEREEGGSTASVTVSVQSQAELKKDDGASVRMVSGMFDLHLFRDRQLVRLVPGQLHPTDGSGGFEARFSGIKLSLTDRNRPVQFSSYAFNNDRVKSATAFGELSLTNGGAPRAARAYVISIGVSRFSDERWNLEFAARDAELMANSLKERLSATRRFSDTLAVPLLSDKLGQHSTGAKKEDLKEALAALSGQKASEDVRRRIPDIEKLRETWPDDLVLLFFSTHGYMDDRGSFFLFPEDIGSGSREDELRLSDSVLERTISSGELADWLQGVDAREIILIVDACQSSAAVAGNGRFRPGPFGGSGFGQLAFNKGMRVLAAAQPLESALETRFLGQGLLTHALLKEGLLEGRADHDPIDGAISIAEWLRYAVLRVPEIQLSIQAADEVKRKGHKVELAVQHPSFFDFGPKLSSINLGRPR